MESRERVGFGLGDEDPRCLGFGYYAMGDARG